LHLQRAQELDPRDADIPTEIGGTYGALRLWKDAERAALRALAIDPHSPFAAEFLLSARLYGTGDVDSAWRAFDAFPEDIKGGFSGQRGYGGGGRWIGEIIGGWRFISTSSKDISPMLSKLSRSEWRRTIVSISSSLPGVSSFACWQDRRKEPNQRGNKRSRYSRPDSESGQTIL
jgi:hypothetical protein